MTEANTTNLWRTPGGFNAMDLCASVPVSSTCNIYADMGISSPMPAFFVSGNTSLPRISA